MYTSQVDKFFKLETPKITKRTQSANPWITDGLIISIDAKHKLCYDYEESKTPELPEGDLRLHEKFVNYRKTLKHAITAAKSKHCCKKNL